MGTNGSIHRSRFWASWVRILIVTAHAVARFAFRCDSSVGELPSGTFFCVPVKVYLSL